MLEGKWSSHPSNFCLLTKAEPCGTGFVFHRKMGSSPPPEDDLTSKTFSDAYFLAQFGGTLPPEVVMDYFAASPFWDKDSANASMPLSISPFFVA
jgi:hypothetical protein